IGGRNIDPKTTAHPCRICYRIDLPEVSRDGLTDRVTSLLAAPSAWIERTRPRPRKNDLRPLIRDIRLCENALEIDLWVTPTGTARPEEVLELLGLDHLLEEGAFFERITLELRDESA